MKPHRPALSAVPALCLAGCARFHSPTVDVLGSYFPAWMICMCAGLALTAIARLMLVVLGVARWVHPAPLIYSCMMTIFTLVVWLAFFQN